MDNQIYQLIINAFSVGTWLQTLLFYSFLAFMFNIILLQTRASSSSRLVSIAASDDEEVA